MAGGFLLIWLARAWQPERTPPYDVEAGAKKDMLLKELHELHDAQKLRLLQLQAQVELLQRENRRREEQVKEARTRSDDLHSQLQTLAKKLANKEGDERTLAEALARARELLQVAERQRDEKDRLHKDEKAKTLALEDQLKIYDQEKTRTALEIDSLVAKLNPKRVKVNVPVRDWPPSLRADPGAGELSRLLEAADAGQSSDRDRAVREALVVVDGIRNRLLARPITDLYRNAALVYLDDEIAVRLHALKKQR